MCESEARRSAGDAFVRASAVVREQFEAQIVAGESWTEGLVAALANMGGGVIEQLEETRRALVELRHDGPEIRRLWDADRSRLLAAVTRGWRHHHPGAPVPELQLELLVGAIAHVIGAAMESGELGELTPRLVGLAAMAPESPPAA